MDADLDKRIMEFYIRETNVEESKEEIKEENGSILYKNDILVKYEFVEQN